MSFHLLELVKKRMPGFITNYDTPLSIRRKIAHRPRQLKKYPTSLFFEINNVCNLRCAYCPRDQVVKQGVKSVGYMDFDLVKKVIDEFSRIARAQKGVEISAGGLGEPLLYKRYFEVVRLIRHRIPEAFITLITNGTVLDENLTKELIDSGLDSVRFSINCWGKDIYKKLHGVDNFEQTVRNVKNFLSMRGCHSPRATLQILDIDGNRERIEHFKSFWKPFLNENDRVLVASLHDFGGFIPVDKFVNEPLERKKRFPCTDLFTTVMIDKEGFIYPCCFGVSYSPDTDICLGNIKEVSLREVYDKGERIRMLRTLHKKKKYDSIYPCNVCNSWTRGGNWTPFIDIGFRWI